MTKLTTYIPKLTPKHTSSKVVHNNVELSQNTKIT